MTPRSLLARTDKLGALLAMCSFGLLGAPMGCNPQRPPTVSSRSSTDSVSTAAGGSPAAMVNPSTSRGGSSGSTTSPASPGSGDDGLRADSRAVLRSARVPLLLPASGAWQALAVITAGDHWTAFSLRDGDLTVSLHATDSHAMAPTGVTPPPRSLRVRGAPATISVNDGIRSVAWEHGEVAYTLEFECFHHDTDERCTRDDFLLATAEALVEARVGGDRQ